MRKQWLKMVLCSSLVATLLAGCGLMGGPTSNRDEQDSEQDYVDSSDASSKITLATGNPAVRDLWAQAEQARKAGDYDNAALTLERILRIAPDDAVIWSRLAEIRLMQGNSGQAENLAAKSNSMSLDNPLLNYRNWLIIARARKLAGNDVGAQEAEYTANSFRP
ncbi:MAG TPA: tetratricopeptide repeat protein [Gammaproteobacteria bacterium]|nr:tetratricopeptide repeat protein [Gammaproteobacteria bacterium]